MSTNLCDTFTYSFITKQCVYTYHNNIIYLVLKQILYNIHRDHQNSWSKINNYDNMHNITGCLYMYLIYIW